MATHYYLYHIPDGRKTLEQERKEKKLLGVQTFENKKRCFTWHMNPGEFMYEAHFFGQFQAVIDEYGHAMILPTWLDDLKKIDIMRYNRDEPLEPEEGSSESPS